VAHLSGVVHFFKCSIFSKSAALLLVWRIFFKRAKIRRTWKSAVHLRKRADLENNTTLEKYPILGKVRHTWKNTAHFKNTPTFEKYATLGKIPHTWKRA